jgi:uncharacterized protein (DUF1697 family)
MSHHTTQTRENRMKTWIGLFRGINVGGNNLLPMKELISDLKSLKLENVRTYIQSGNVVFDSEQPNIVTLAKSITDRIEKRHGFRPQVLIMGSKDLQRAIDANPFPEAVSDPKSLHFFFLEKPPTAPNIKALDQAKSPTEAYQLKANVFYLHAPEGVGRSKLASSAEKHLGVTATARNYRTVAAIAAMASP